MFDGLSAGYDFYFEIAILNKIFNGTISTHFFQLGYRALKDLDLEVENYFASEIDEDAILVSSNNNYKNIKYLGDVRNITASKVFFNYIIIKY